MNIQDLLPFERFTLQANLPNGEAAKRLTAHVAPLNKTARGVVRIDSGYPYMGEITESGFKIYNTEGGRNFFVPEITGVITPEGSGTRVEVTVKMARLTAVFTGLWLFGTSLESVLGIVQSNLQLVVWGLPSFVVYIVAMVFFFKRESANAKKFLSEVLGSNR
jgi:hypothetical protein